MNPLVLARLVLEARAVNARRIAVLAIALSFVDVAKAAPTWSVTSPNGVVRISVQLADLSGQKDYPAGARLYYRVEHGLEANRAAVIEDSPLGLKLQNQDFTTGLILTNASEPRLIDERYTMLHGKRRDCDNRANEITLAFRNAAGAILELDVRAYDNGAAFRYRLPGSGVSLLTLDAELTGFALPVDAKLWMHPADKASVYSPAYETYYENEIASGTPSPTGNGWSYPVLFRTGDGRYWGLITEAGLSRNFCGTRLAGTAPGGVYRIALPDSKEGHGTGSVYPSASLPWELPWRAIMLGNSPGDIVESTLVTDLSAPSRVTETGWVKPGRVAWSWWSDNPSPQDGAKQKKFVDLAAKMGWEYVLVDANWDIMDNGNIHDVIRYAKKKGVGVLLWYNSGGPHNIVTEKPRDTLFFPEVRKFEFDLLRKWGVRGVKVDFFQSDKQNVIELYHDLMRDSAAAQILINFHGCTLPRGWERTWPNLMSMEAVRGEECYIFDDKFPERAPVQNTITPFTRNAVGPMDYTPVGFSNNRYPHRTTYAHELALAALFESGWVHFADKPEAYLSLPKAPKEFLKTVPTAWDDTRFVAGYPGQFVVLARRRGDTWYVVGVNGRNEARTETLSLGPWFNLAHAELTLIQDGADAKSFASQTKSFATGDKLTVKMLPYGGFVAIVKPAR